MAIGVSKAKRTIFISGSETAGKAELILLLCRRALSVLSTRSQF